MFLTIGVLKTRENYKRQTLVKETIRKAASSTERRGKQRVRTPCITRRRTKQNTKNVRQQHTTTHSGSGRKKRLHAEDKN